MYGIRSIKGMFQVQFYLCRFLNLASIHVKQLIRQELVDKNYETFCTCKTKVEGVEGEGRGLVDDADVGWVEGGPHNVAGLTAVKSGKIIKLIVYIYIFYDDPNNKFLFPSVTVPYIL